jgi:hypothetical protein
MIVCDYLSANGAEGQRDDAIGSMLAALAEEEARNVAQEEILIKSLFTVSVFNATELVIRSGFRSPNRPDKGRNRTYRTG